MTAETLNAMFGVANILVFEETATGLVRARISTAGADATIYLQGAHLTHWQPAGDLPVLFLATHSRPSPGEEIRGGIPVVFPWFGSYVGDSCLARSFGKHGFARTLSWTLKSASISDDGLQVCFQLLSNEQSRAMGFGEYRLEYMLRIGRALELELVAMNEGTEILHFEEALHTYFAVEDVARTSLRGLAGDLYLDALDHFQPKRQTPAELRFGRQTDSVYLDTAATCVLRDRGNRRLIRIEKSGSRTTVAWNPGEESGVHAGIGAGDWHKFVCVESANARSNAISLAPGETHRLAVRISVLVE